ncbi:MAG: stretch-activated cation channel mid1 [Claussenomyces sp. TS43310]|nr:MAG: stretch-activated cation channel mid1 [Claussenomyces sp. TS43310]
MPLPKLSPLQSRLAASLAASVVLLILYFTLTFPDFAYASEVDSIEPEDHNHERLLRPWIPDDQLVEAELEELAYEADFLGFDRGIIGRAPPVGSAPLMNNVPRPDNVKQGETNQYIFPNSSLWVTSSAPGVGLPPFATRQRSSNEAETRLEDLDEGLQGRDLGSRSLYITITTCLQPYPVDSSGAAGPPPQVTLYVSTSSGNDSPGPGSTLAQEMVILEEGYGNITINATGDVYLAVSAPNTTNQYSQTDVYNIELAASIDAPYHSYEGDEPNLYLIDSDTSSALLITNNLTQAANGSVYDQWMNLAPPYVVFASNQNNTLLNGVRKSYCGLELYAQIAGTKDGMRTNMVQTSMTNVTLGSLPKQQFYFQGLNGSSSYYGILAMNGNSTNSGAGVVGGGGRVWHNMSFVTQSDGNCAVVFNLTFCETVAYAVPGNPGNISTTDLAAWYDNSAQTQYQFFDYALQQIPCEITASGQYSLARNCTDCASAYKDWLCSVMIPRCMDYSSTADWLHERNVVQTYPNGTMLDSAIVNAAQNTLYLNSSRNPTIDSHVAPGPYKEILPCNDLCYNLVRDCPASMGFSCPVPGQLGFSHSYGLRPDGSPAQAGQITCNYPGAAYDLDAGMVNRAPILLMAVITGLLGAFLI